MRDDNTEDFLGKPTWRDTAAALLAEALNESRECRETQRNTNHRLRQIRARLDRNGVPSEVLKLVDIYAGLTPHQRQVADIMLSEARRVLGMDQVDWIAEKDEDYSGM